MIAIDLSAFMTDSCHTSSFFSSSDPSRHERRERKCENCLCAAAAENVISPATRFFTPLNSTAMAESKSGSERHKKLCESTADGDRMQ